MRFLEDRVRTNVRDKCHWQKLLARLPSLSPEKCSLVCSTDSHTQLAELSPRVYTQTSFQATWQAEAINSIVQLLHNTKGTLLWFLLHANRKPVEFPLTVFWYSEYIIGL